jgi:hypothetical protein
MYNIEIYQLCKISISWGNKVKCVLWRQILFL